MAAQKKIHGVIFIEKTFCQIITDASPTVFTFQYPPQIIQDLEILQIDEFHRQLIAFLTQNKIPMGEFIMVLGNNLFFVKDIKKTVPTPTPPNTKPLPKKDPEAISSEEVEIQAFLSNVPFENVSFKVFKKDQLIRILATNRELFEAFKKNYRKTRRNN